MGDITQQKKAEEVLKSAEEKYRLIVDNAYDGISIIDASTHKAVFINPALQKMLGYSLDDYCQYTIFDLVYAEDREKVLNALELGLEKGENTVNFRYRKKDGTYIWLDTTGKVMESDKTKWLFTSRNINEQKVAEARLRYSEERYRMIADNSFLMIYTVCPFTREILYGNSTIGNILGYQTEEILGTDGIEYVHPDDVEHVLAEFNNIIKTGKGSDIYRARKKDGNYIWIETMGKLIRNSNQDGEILLFARDINNSKQAEEALREQEQRLQMITDNMLDGIVFINTEKQIEYVGPSFYKILGYQLPQIKGMGIELRGIHPDDYDKIIEFINVFDQKESAYIQCRAVHAQGRYVWLEAAGKAIIDNGIFSGWVFGIRDISARKKAEEELQKQLDYQNYLMDNMNESFYTYDRDLRLTYVNQKVCERLGYAFDEMMGRSILDFVHAEDREIVKNNALRRLQEGNKDIYEHRVVSKDGSILLFWIRVSPIFENGRIIGGQVVAEDVTDYRKMEQEMVRLAQLHTVGEIAAGIGHEIRNPMTTVRGFLQILAQDPEVKSYRPSFDLMLEELDRANNIISEFLSLAKDKIADFSWHNLNDIISTIFPLLQADALVSDKYIQLNLGKISVLWLDEKEIRQLIINLVRNGLEAMEAGGCVEIGTQKRRNEVILTVKDQGRGMDKGVKEKLGTPFFTTKENGTGLGMAICYSIIRRHNARVKVESGKNGTTFQIGFKA